MSFRFARRNPWLTGTACFAMLWAIARAHLQSITIDEADTYLAFVRPSEVYQWFPASNNHVLNSLLMRLTTSLFGASNFTVRMPALIGAALYISAAYLLVRMIAREPPLRWILFVCLVYNPFVFDHLVAARGYGLALGFLLWAIAAPAYYQHRIGSERTASLRRACAISSLCVAFSIAANFSFAFAGAAVLSGTFLWCAHKRRFKEYLALVAACALPALTASLFLTASVVLNFPKKELYFGSTSLRQMFLSIRDHSFYQPSPEILNPLLLPVVRHSAPFLLWLIAILGVTRLVLVVVNRHQSGTRWRNWLVGIGATLAGATAFTVLLHWIAFRKFHVPLPRDRTALFFAPLAVLLLGVIGAARTRSRVATYCRAGFTTTLLLLSLYFISCLRLTYFKDWYWDRDVEAAYSVLAYYNHRYGVRDIATQWYYSSALNFYRVVSGHETINEFVNMPPDPDYPTNKPIYVLFDAFSERIIAEQKLKVVFKGRNSELVIAIRPELEGP